MTLPASGYWSSVCYGDEKYVAVSSSNAAAYSEDGINWTETTMPSSTSWTSVCYGNGKYVAVANSNAAAYSYPTLTNKSTDVVPKLETSFARYFVQDSELFAIPVAKRTTVYNDVIDHTLPGPIDPSTSAYGVSVYANSITGRKRAEQFYQFLANNDVSEGLSVISGNAFMQSTEIINTDGILGIGFELPSFTSWRSVCYGDGKYVAVAHNSKAAYSTDGINWTAATLPSRNDWYSVCYGDGKYVAVAYNSNNAAYSEDGINWTVTTMPSSDDWYSVCYGDGKYVAVTNSLFSYAAAYSEDGINWTTTTMPSKARWTSVCYGDEKYVAAGYGKTAYSEDGINLTTTTMPSSTSLYSICYGDGKYVAVINGSNAAAYSTDGINWTATTMPSSTSGTSVCYGDGKYVAIAYDSNKAAYSEDGINWTAATLPFSDEWDSVCYGDGKYVAVAYDSNKAVTLQAGNFYKITGEDFVGISTPEILYLANSNLSAGQNVSICLGNVSKELINSDLLPETEVLGLPEVLDRIFDNGGDT
ncbi:MAG: hypothetical protein KBT06_00595 [Prevotellaceae bacterium]|nr:hypothetical protein [Candidatus Colivivens equi]